MNSTVQGNRWFANTVDKTEYISPLVMLPEHRLSVLLDNIKQNQIDKCLYHSTTKPLTLYSDHLCDRSMFPTDVMLDLEHYAGEVYQIAFSHSGDRIAACGSAKGIFIWETAHFDLTRVLDGHDTGEAICNIAWSPDDTMLVTCGIDRYAKLWNTAVRFLPFFFFRAQVTDSSFVHVKMILMLFSLWSSDWPMHQSP